MKFMTEPLVSIIIPTYNRAQIIKETLDSVLAQTYQNWECIVVDDGSVDNTSEIMAAYMMKDKRFQFHHRPKDRLPGGNASRNYGFELSKGEYINWFDSDDKLLPNFISDKINKFQSSGNYDVVFSAYQKFNETVRPKVFNNKFSGNIINDLANKSVIFSTHSYMLKRDVLSGHSFDERVLKSQDLDFFFRLFSSNSHLKIGNVADVTHLYRKHEDTISDKASEKGQSYKSRYKIQLEVLDYFLKEYNPIGIKRYRALCVSDLKKILMAKDYSFVYRKVLDANYLKTSEKLKLLLVTFVYSLNKRGLNLFKINR